MGLSEASPEHDPPARSLAWLTLAFVGLCFGAGRWEVPVASPLGLVFLVRFFRHTPPRVAVPLSTVALAASAIISSWGMNPSPLPSLVATYLMTGLLTAALLAVDRWLARRLDHFVATLALPALDVALVAISASAQPFGTWGLSAYALFGELPLLQTASLTGVWGVEFLLIWVATVANWAWDRGFDPARVRRGAGVFAAIVLGLSAWGGWRLNRSGLSAPTARVAGITVDTQGVLPLPRLLALLSEPQPPETWEALRPRFAALNDRLFALTEREARAGARVVVWSEGNAAVLAADEAALLARAQAAARELEIELALAVAVWHPTGPHRLSNKVLWVRPTGALAWEYLKARPVPGPEADHSARGDGRMRTVDTAVGRYGVAICFDGDFPAQLRQARALGVDVVVSPSQDWPAITPQHSQMIAFRAIEDGVTYFRQTNRGLSLVTDPWGRTLGRMDHFAASDRVLVAQVPTRGVSTVYGALGDWFPGVCLLGAVALVAQGLRTHPRRSGRGGGALASRARLDGASGADDTPPGDAWSRGGS